MKTIVTVERKTTFQLGFLEISQFLCEVVSLFISRYGISKKENHKVKFLHLSVFLIAAKILIVLFSDIFQYLIFEMSSMILPPAY